MATITLVQSSFKYVVFQVEFPCKQCVIIKFINMVGTQLQSLSSKTIYCNGKQHLVATPYDPENFDQIILFLAMNKIQIHDDEYCGQKYQSDFFYGFDGIVYGNCIIWLDFCGMNFQQYFQALESIKKTQVEKEKIKLKNLILNLHHRGIYHSDPQISKLKYVFVQDTITKIEKVKPIFILAPQTTILQKNELNHQKFKNEQRKCQQMLTFFDSYKSSEINKKYARLQWTIQQKYKELISQKCPYYTTEKFKEIQPLLKLSKIYAIIAIDNFKNFKEKLLLLVDRDLHQSYIEKWNQINKSSDMKYWKEMREKYKKSEEIILAIQSKNSIYQPDLAHNKTLGWGQININFFLKNQQNQLYQRSLAEYCEKIKQLPFKKTRLRYHFYKYKLDKIKKRFIEAKWHISQCLKYTKNVEELIVIYHQFAIIAGQLMQFRDQMQWNVKTLLLKERIYGLYSLKNLKTLYNILYCFFTVPYIKQNYNLKTYFNKLDKIKKKNRKEELTEWVKQTNRHKLVTKVQKCLETHFFTKNLSEYFPEGFQPQKKNLSLQKRIKEFSVNIELNRYYENAEISKLFLEYVIDQSQKYKIEERIQKMKKQLRNKKNQVYLLFLQAQICLDKGNLNEGLKKFENLKDLNNLSNGKYMKIIEHLYNIYKHMEIYEKILNNYYLKKNRIMNIQSQTFPKCVQYCILCIKVGTEGGIKNYSEAHRVLSLLIQKQSNVPPILLYLYAETNMYFRKYKKVVEFVEKLIDSSLKGKGEEKFKYQVFRMVSQIKFENFSFSTDSVISMLFKALYELKDYQKCYFIMKEVNFWFWETEINNMMMYVCHKFNNCDLESQIYKNNRILPEQMTISKPMLEIVYCQKGISGVMQMCEWISMSEYSKSKEIAFFDLFPIDFYEALLKILFKEKSEKSTQKLLVLLPIMVEKKGNYENIINNNLEQFIDLISLQNEEAYFSTFIKLLLDFCTKMKGKKSYHVLKIYKTQIKILRGQGKFSDSILLQAYIKDVEEENLSLEMVFFEELFLQKQTLEVREKFQEIRQMEQKERQIKSIIKIYQKLKDSVDSLLEDEDSEDLVNEIDEFKWKAQSLFPKCYYTCINKISDLLLSKLEPFD